VAAVHICIRRTVDWSDERAFWEQLSAKHRPRVELFNRTFELPFHEFRRRLREISHLNHERVEGAGVTSWDQVPEGEIALPVDDDDWFAPDAASIVAGCLPRSAAGCRWLPTWIQVPASRAQRISPLWRRLREVRPKLLCTTNNYALVKGRAPYEVMRFHVRASNWFEERVGSGEVVLLRRRLSLVNRSIGSLSTLGTSAKPLSQRALLARYRRYRRLYRRQPPADLDWARPYIERMDRLMSELEPIR
jgi:hypothetical protein